MEWIEVKIETTSDGVEICTAVLLECGISGVSIEDEFATSEFLEESKTHWDYADDSLLFKEKGVAYVVFYVTRDQAGNETLRSAQSAFERLKNEEKKQGFGVDLGKLEFHMENVDDKNWLDNWKKYYKPFLVGKHMVVKPIWEEYEKKPDELVLNMNPGHVFGTGLHQSTQLSMEALEEFVRTSHRVLDLGCGSGILSITALLLGAKQAVAVDIDASAVDIVCENAQNNGISNECYQVYSGNLLEDEQLCKKVSTPPYDIVVANIIADVVMAYTPLAKSLLKQGGLFIGSGIILSREKEVVQTLEANGFCVKKIVVRDEWVCVVAKLLNDE